MTSPQQQVLAKCAEVSARAKELFGVDLSKVGIRFDLKGRVAGYACARGFLGDRSYHMRFNYDMLMRGDAEVLRDMLEDTVPHEIAHIVCFMKPQLGRNHDAGWASVARALGSTGNRTHDMDVVYGKGYTYEYTTCRGVTVRVGDRHHATVQRGQTLRFKQNKGTISKSSAYSVVGYQGRTLSTPVVKQAAPVATVQTPVMDIVRPAPVYVPRPVPAPVVQAPVKTVAPAFARGVSKADMARAIMRSGHSQGKSYEEIIAAIMQATGHDRQLSRSYYKNNAAKVGVPLQ